MSVSIARKAVHGAGWNVLAGVGSRIVALVGTLILTRFIAPGEYGEISAATIAVATAMLLTDASVGQAIIARQASPAVCFHAFVLHMTTGLAGLATLFVVAGPVGRWLDTPGMTRYLPGFVLAALLERLALVPGRLLVRDLDFRTVAITRGGAEILFTGVALALAPRLHGDAIVIGNIARFALIAGVFLARADRREWFVPQPLRWPVFRELLGFGLPLSVAVATDYAATNWDSMLVARYFGPSTMGAYRLSRSLADTPVTNFAEHLGDVLLPSFAMMDPGRRPAAVLRAAGLMALLVFPLCVGLASVAPTVVRALLDPRWADIAPFLTILSFAVLSRPLSWSVVAFLQAQQRTRELMLSSFVKLAATLALLVTMGRTSAILAGVAVGLGRYSSLAVDLSFASRDGVSARRFLARAGRGLAACAPMYAAVVLARPGIDRLVGGRAGLALVLEIALGAISYLVGALVFARPMLLDAVGLVREGLARRKAPAAEPLVQETADG
jgi:lipopolysaccharide exporter